MDLSSERATLLVRRGKGGKDRLLPIGRRALGWVGRYLVEARRRLCLDPEQRALFVGRLGEELSADYLSRLTSRYVQAAGLGKDGSCHMLRHTMATLMLENGADIRFIQQMLGHEHLSTTQIYTRVSLRQLQRVHAATHPAEMSSRIDSEDAQNRAERDAP